MRQETKDTIADFFGRERQNLLRYLRNRAADLSEMDLEDAIGEIMLSLVDKADLAGQIENLAAYVYRAVRNKTIDFLRRRRRLVPLDEAALGDNRDVPGRGPSDGGGSDLWAEIRDREFREQLVAALDELEPRQRAVWIATEVEGYPFRELAELWGEPIGTLLARKHRATAALRKSLADWRT
jgi:RNA polymerase sigma factor (sigma-70 family)